ncbi:MAG: FadR/GntR family transcriptional regulator [Angelakisella sp.]
MFEQIKQPNLLKEIFGQLKQNIRTGKLKKGDYLPSEREWAATLGVSRTTLREAIKAMELVGLLGCVQGSGNYIPTDLSHALSEPVSVMFMLENGTAQQVVEFRQAIEIASVRKLAKMVTPEQLLQLEDLMTGMSRETDPGLLAHMDQQFHRLTVELTGNPLIISMMNAAEGLIEKQIYDVRSLIMRDETTVAQMKAQHSRLMDAIRAHNAEEATAAVIDHLDFAGNFQYEGKPG